MEMGTDKNPILLLEIGFEIFHRLRRENVTPLTPIIRLRV